MSKELARLAPRNTENETVRVNADQYITETKLLLELSVFYQNKGAMKHLAKILERVHHNLIFLGTMADVSVFYMES